MPNEPGKKVRSKPTSQRGFTCSIVSKIKVRFLSVLTDQIHVWKKGRQLWRASWFTQLVINVRLLNTHTLEGVWFRRGTNTFRFTFINSTDGEISPGKISGTCNEYDAHHPAIRRAVCLELRTKDVQRDCRRHPSYSTQNRSLTNILTTSSHGSNKVQSNRPVLHKNIVQDRSNYGW